MSGFDQFKMESLSSCINNACTNLTSAERTASGFSGIDIDGYTYSSYLRGVGNTISSICSGVKDAGSWVDTRMAEAIIAEIHNYEAMAKAGNEEAKLMLKYQKIRYGLQNASEDEYVDLIKKYNTDPNTKIANNAKLLGEVLRDNGWGYNEMNEASNGNIYVPIVDSEGNRIYDYNQQTFINTTGTGPGISCATFVTQVLYDAGLYNEGARVVWARHDPELTIEEFAEQGLTVVQIDPSEAQPGDILHWKGEQKSGYHTAIVTDINEDGSFRKTSSAEFMDSDEEKETVNYNRADRGHSGWNPKEYLDDWYIYRVVDFKKVD